MSTATFTKECFVFGSEIRVFNLIGYSEMISDFVHFVFNLFEFAVDLVFVFFVSNFWYLCRIFQKSFSIVLHSIKLLKNMINFQIKYFLFRCCQMCSNRIYMSKTHLSLMNVEILFSLDISKENESLDVLVFTFFFLGF